MLFLEHASCVLTQALQAPGACGPLSVCVVGFPSFTPGVRFSGAPALPWFRVAVSLPTSHQQPGFLRFVSSPPCRHGSSPGRRCLPSRGLPYTPAGVSSAHTRGPVRNAFSSGSWGASPRGPRMALRHCLGLWRRGRQAQPSGAPWGVRAPEGCWSECVRGWCPGEGETASHRCGLEASAVLLRWCTRSGSPSVGDRTRRSPSELRVTRP